MEQDTKQCLVPFGDDGGQRKGIDVKTKMQDFAVEIVHRKNVAGV